MSLVVLVKTDREGFAFSDGALSTPEPRMLRADCSKLVTVRHDLIVAAGGDGVDSENLRLKVGELPRNIPFRDALAFLRSELAEHHRLYGTTAAGPDATHNLGVGLLGSDAGAIRLIGWDVHSGEEQENPEWDNWSMGVSDPARIVACGLMYPAFQRYQSDRNRDAFITAAEAAFKAAATLEPQRIAGFYWAHAASVAGNCAIDPAGNLLLKNAEQADGSTVNPSTASISFADMPEMTRTITTQGNKILILFGCLCYNDTALNGGLFQLMRGSTVLPASGGFVSVAIGSRVNVSFSYLDTQAAGTYTYKIQWEANPGGTCYNVGLQRFLQVIELG